MEQAQRQKIRRRSLQSKEKSELIHFEDRQAERSDRETAWLARYRPAFDRREKD